MDENWATLWERVGDAMPDDVATVQGDTRRTRAELDDRAARLATGLAGLGVGGGDKVGLLLYNCPEYLEAVYAAFKLRAMPVNLNFRYRATELLEVLADAAAEVLVFHASLAPVVAEVRAQLPGLRLVVVADGTPSDGAAALGAVDYEELATSPEPAPRQQRSGDDVFVLYTGGTTGRPRGVLWRHRDIVGTVSAPAYALAGVPQPADADAAAAAAVELHRSGQAPVFLAASPLIHGVALYLSQGAWLLGGTAVFLPSRSLDADELWRVVQTERVNQIAIVGDIFAKRMVEALERAEPAGTPYDLTSVQRITSSGVLWSARWKQGLADRGSMMLVDVVGASEGGPFTVQITPPGGQVSDASFVLGPKSKLIREDGTVIEPGTDEVGMLAVAPPVPLGYANDPQKSAALLREVDGVVHCVPGDYARFAPDGSVVLLGRGSLCINTGGEKVYPEEVERAIKTCPGVADVNVVGLPDDRWGQAITAVVAPAEGTPPTPELAAAVQDTVRGLLAGYKVPRFVVFVDEVLRTPAGKARYAWATEVATQALAVSSPAAAADDLAGADSGRA